MIARPAPHALYDRHRSSQEYGAALLDGLRGLYEIDTSGDHYRGFRRIVWSPLLRHGLDPNRIEFSFQEDAHLRENARVEIARHADTIAVRLRHRPFTGKDSRFGREMVLHEARHVYQALFLAPPNPTEPAHETDAKQFQEVTYDLHRALSSLLSAFFALRNFIHLGNVVDAKGAGLTPEEQGRLDNLVGQLLVMQRSNHAHLRLFSEVGLNQIKIATAVARARQLVDGGDRPSQSQLEKHLAVLRALPSNELDAELFAATCDFSSLLHKRLAEITGLPSHYEHAMKYLLAGLQALPSARSIKYLVDCLNAWGNARKDPAATMQARVLFAFAFGIPHFLAISKVFALHVSREAPHLLRGVMLKIDHSWLRELQTLPTLSADPDYAVCVSAQLRQAGLGGLTVDFASAALMLTQFYKDKQDTALLAPLRPNFSGRIDINLAAPSLRVYLVAKSLVYVNMGNLSRDINLRAIIPYPMLNKKSVDEVIEKVTHCMKL